MRTLKALLALGSSLLLSVDTFAETTLAETVPVEAALTEATLNEGGSAAPSPTTRFTLYHQADTNKARSAIDDIRVYDAEVNLLDDNDGDAHYSRFEVVYDADDLGGQGRYAYTVVSLIDETGDRHELFTSPTFYIDGDSPYDAQRHLITLLNDHPTADYRLRIDLYEACCDYRLDTLITSTQSLIPLEGQYQDDDSYGETYMEMYYSDETGGAGGSWSVAGVGGLGLLYVLRRRRLEQMNVQARASR